MFLHGTSPDAVILCVNIDDDMDYIKRTINYIEAYVDTKIIALVIYPFVREILYGGFLKKKKLEEDESVNLFRDKIKEIYAGPVFYENGFENCKKLVAIIEDYLTRE